MPALTVHNAQIQTASVEIKTLTISGKQVTLAVFRQLREAALIADDGTFIGLPWGVVNYHPDKTCGTAAHHHVVWQQGANLQRCAVRRPRFEDLWIDECDALLQAEFCRAGHQDPTWAQRCRVREGGSSYWQYQFKHDGLPCVAFDPQYHADPSCLEADSAGLFQDLSHSVAQEKERRLRTQQRWAEIQDLPQLFIAI